MSDYIIHSTPKVRVGAYGATLSDANNLLNIQDANVDEKFLEAIVRGAAYLNQFPTASVRYDGDIAVVFTTISFCEEMIPYVTGASAVTGGGKRTYTPTLTSVPQQFQVELVYLDIGGVKNIKVNCPSVFCNDFPFNVTRTDFGKSTFTVNSRPGASDAPIVITVDT